MADAKISALTAVTTPASTDEFVVNQGGTTKKLTSTNLFGIVPGNVTLGSTAADGGSITIIKGAQSGDPQCSIALSADANGDMTIACSGDLNLSPTNGIDWTGGNVIYVPVADGTVLQSYCTAATAGDVLELGAGTYALTTNSLTPAKALTIRGKGVDRTIVTFTTGAVVYSASNIKFENLTLSKTDTTSGITLFNNTTDGLSGCDLTNVKLTVSHSTGTGTAVLVTTTKPLGGTWQNVIATVTSADGGACGIQAYNFAGTAETLNIYNSSIAASNTGTNKASYGLLLRDNSSAGVFGVNIYNSVVIASETGSSDGHGINVQNGASASVACYESRLNGSQYDAVQASSSVLTLSNCTLANNTTSGTITYAGTVVSAAGKFGATPVAVAPHASAKVIAQDGTASGSASVQLLTAADGVEYIFFGDVDSATRSYLQCTQSTDTFKWIAGTAEVLHWNSSGNFGIGQSSWGSNAQKTLAIGNTAGVPTTSPADAVQLYSADVGGVAGSAGAHVRGELGGVAALNPALGTLNTYTYQKDDLADDGTVSLPDATSGIVIVSCNAEAGMWLVQNNGAVVKIAGSTNTAATESDGNLCVYDGGGTQAIVKNMLGTAGETRIVYHYN